MIAENHPTTRPPDPPSSYSSLKSGPVARMREFVSLYRRHSRSAQAKVRWHIERLLEMEAEIKDVSGRECRNLEILEIGPGQRFRQMNYFARSNEVTGIDLDELVQGFSPLGYLRMLRSNGATRVIKTLGRKLIGADIAFRKEMDRQLNSRAPRRFNVHRMDATSMSFPDASFDMVYSYSVFEHIPACERVLNEVARVLRPGGVAHISLHLYTSESGCHDPRLFSGKRDRIPYWSHLRPAHQSKVCPNSFLNKVRLDQWDQMYRDAWPGVRLHRRRFGEHRLRKELAALRADGELAEYSDEELLTMEHVAVWQKPL